MPSKEAQARIKINKLLEKAGWRFFDDEKGSANIRLELNVKIKEMDINKFGADFETTKNGFVDFLLLDNTGKPLVVLEAKSENKNPLDGKEITARENEKSALRKNDIQNAYTNCHTDITIPYDELGTIVVITKNGEKIDILRNGRFAVKGTEELNVPLDELDAKK